jgi:hypothetical protein
VTFAPSATIGGLVSATGIVMGNAAIWKMMNAYKDSLSERSETGEMFLTVETVTSVNQRAEATKWYRKTYPNGPFLRMLRRGQVLTVMGFLVVFALLAI